MPCVIGGIIRYQPTSVSAAAWRGFILVFVAHDPLKGKAEGANVLLLIQWNAKGGAIQCLSLHVLSVVVGGVSFATRCRCFA